LTNTPEDEGVPAWSPDGEKIAYVVDPLVEPAIYVMDTNGSGQKRLVDAIGPPGHPMVNASYTTYSNGERLAVMNADGSEQRSLGGSLVRSLTGTADAYEAAWSSNGKRIAFVSSRGSNNEEVYLMNADGSGRTRLTDIPGNDHWPRKWSPDSTRIAFTSDGIEEHAQIYVMNSDGSGLTWLTDNPADDSLPAWRP
jgi:TolB protein